MTDKTPVEIAVWVCPQCGYWRDEELTGVHVVYPRQLDRPGQRHTLKPVTYFQAPACSSERAGSES